MINKNILRDVFTCKKNIGIVLISDLVQAIFLVLASLIIAFLANAMLFSELDKTAVPLMALLFCFLLGRSILAYINRLQVESISLTIQTKLRMALLGKLSRGRGTNLSQSQWVALITKGVDKLDVYVNNFLPQLGILIVTPITLLLVAFYMDWISALIFFFTAPLIPGFMILIGKLAQGENQRQWAVFQKLSAFMVDFLPGLLVLKAFNQVDQQLAVLKERGDQFSKVTLKVLRIAFLSAFMLELISTLSIALIAVNIGLRLIYGDGTFFPLMFILLIAPLFYNPLRQFGAAFHDGMNGLTAAGDIYALLTAEEVIEEEELGEDSKPWDLQVRGLTYTYPEGRGTALQNFSGEFKFGTQVVLTGPNGSGKSTFFKLLLGLLKADQGEILLQGKELNTLSKDWYYSHLGYIQQAPKLFTTTIRENILMGREFAEEQLQAVLQEVNLTSWLEELPQGIDTVLAKGVKVSSGQLRRIGLARALIGEPKLLLLDEPMENLDPENEALIQRILMNLKGKATVLIIGHRRQTLYNADQVLYLEQGELKFLGSGEEFLNSELGEVVKHV